VGHKKTPKADLENQKKVRGEKDQEVGHKTDHEDRAEKRGQDIGQVLIVRMHYLLLMKKV
jgi:hypothetical protein